MKNFIFISIIIYSVALISCSKADNARLKFSGPKKISRYQWIKADSLSGEFNNVIYDIDTLGKVILWDNASDTYNDAYFYTSIFPAGFGFKGVGLNNMAIGWYVDADKYKSLTFFSEPNPGNVFYITYALDKKVNGKIVLTGVFTSNQDTFKEIIELTPISED